MKPISWWTAIALLGCGTVVVRAARGAEGDFGPEQVVSPTARNVWSVFATDLDGDGDADVLSASEVDNKIAWYENTDYLGNFGPERIISTAASKAHSVFAVDLDGDGDADVLSASSGDDKIAWYENIDGRGSFGPERVISTTADGAYSVYATDLDGDGDQDVLSASPGDDKLAWYENTDGLGSFGPERIIPAVARGATSVWAADLDGDGDQDVISSSFHDDRIAWYENTDGRGSFGWQRTISTAADGAISVFACDVDGDGDADVLSASVHDDKVAWYENTDGRGSFGPQRAISASTNGAHSVFAADVDGDGDADALAASNLADRIVWFENTDGLGSFGSPRVIANQFTGARCVFALDIDGDGDSDVLSAAVGEGKLAWFENDPLDSDGFGPRQIITSRALDARSVFAADLDGDGDQDALSASPADSKIAWYENTDGLGGFGPPQIISTTALYARSVYAADLDGDGDQDVLSASAGDNTIAWYENTNGSGSFGPQQVITALANFANTVFAIDIDGDGDQDVLSASYDELAWYENVNGLGNFGPGQVISTAFNALRHVFAADLDGDGDADVLSASSGDNKIAWYENADGLGHFGPQRIITNQAAWALSVLAADIDGDGDQDVLSASASDDTVAWYENSDGRGSFGPRRVISDLADVATSVFAADIDGDGDLDVLSTSIDDDKIAWYENTNGLGSFDHREFVLSLSSDRAWCVTAADFDGDGDPDALSASEGDDTIAWHENLISGFFTRYGTGSAGTDGVVPTLFGRGWPSTGLPLSVEIRQGRPDALGLFLIGLTDAHVVLPGGAVLLVGNLIGGTGYLIVLDGSGNLSIPMTLGPAVTGNFYMQALLEDSGAGNGRFSATNGLELSIP